MQIVDADLSFRSSMQPPGKARWFNPWPTDRWYQGLGCVHQQRVSSSNPRFLTVRP